MTTEPGEDKWLDPCRHYWVDTYTGAGLSKETPDKTILVFYCRRCLAFRYRTIDTSQVLISPETKELYDDTRSNPTTVS